MKRERIIIRDRSRARAWLAERVGPIVTEGPVLRASDVARHVGLPTRTIVAHLIYGCGVCCLPSADPWLDAELAVALVTYWAASPPIDTSIAATELLVQ